MSALIKSEEYPPLLVVPTFANISAIRKTKLEALDAEEFMQFGTHVYIFKKEANISEILHNLNLDGLNLPESPLIKKPTVQHLHVYCHVLTGHLNQSRELVLRPHDVGYTLKSLHVFTAQLPKEISRITFLSNYRETDHNFQMCLYYDVESGPDRLWVNSMLSEPIHLLQNDNQYLECLGTYCENDKHYYLPDPGTAGIQMLVSATQKNGSVDSVNHIQSVCWNELRAPRLFEFQKFGADARRLFNLPRLLESLFISAGEELMRSQPDVTRVMAQLRFIQRCGQYAPNLSGLLTEAERLLHRLALPREFPEEFDYSNSEEEDIPNSTIVDSTTEPTQLLIPYESSKNRFCYVPEKLPQSLARGMDATVLNLIEATRTLETQEQNEAIKDLIQKTGDATMKAMMLAMGGSQNMKARMEHAFEQATGATLDVSQKKVDLQKYDVNVDEAQKAFQIGIEKYEQEVKKEFWTQLAVSVFEIVGAVAIAVYSGGGGAPVSVAMLNNVLKGAEAVKISSRLWIALKTLAETALKLAPKIQTAVKDHQKFTTVGPEKAILGNIVKKQIQKTTDGITEQAYATKSSNIQTIGIGPTDERPDDWAGKRIDYAGMHADWREMDLVVDIAFATIKKEIGDHKIDGMEDYQIALKKVVVRGETLVDVMREAYVARTKLMLLEADKQSQDAATKDIQVLREQLAAQASTASTAAMALKFRLVTELAQRRRVVFNMLYEGVLALLYHSNNLSTQRETFALLSPALEAAKLADYWAEFKSATEEDKQLQGHNIHLNTKNAFPVGWKDLLLYDLEVPFQIPPTLDELEDQHCMRIRSIHAEFVGLTSKDSSVTSLDKLEYTIWLGPLMYDRASPYENARSSAATTMQYYMNRAPLKKQGKEGSFIDDGHAFAKRTVCCQGKISFNRKVVTKEKLNFATVTDIWLHIEYETMVFND